MNTEQEIKSIQANLDRLYSELNGVRAMVMELSKRTDNSDLKHYMPKVGEVVEVSDDMSRWHSNIYDSYKWGKFHVIAGRAESDYRNGVRKTTIERRYCRRLNGEIIEFGCDAKQPERDEAEQTNPYAVDWTNAPDWADVHCWDECGAGYWFGANSSIYKKEWGYDYERSNFTLPDGLDWKLSKTFRPR